MSVERIEAGFVSMARQQPDAPALLLHDERISYGELLAMVSAAAEALGPGGPVAIHASKRASSVASLLGCLMAGRPYVPLDVNSPPARTSAILRDCGAALLVYDDAASERPRLPGDLSVDVVGFKALIRRPPGAAAMPQRGPAAADRGERAFILYTSGSTGVPKGAVTTRRNVLAFMRWVMNDLPVAPGDVVACCAPLHFDMHIFDVLCALAQGATVALVPDDALRLPQALAELLSNWRASVMYAVPSVWIGLLRYSSLPRTGLPSLRLLAYSGEEFPVAQLRELAGCVPGSRIVNVYGPVETNAITAFELSHADLERERIPIGRPVGDNRVFVVDEQGALVTAPGEEGELWCSGPNVFEGYLNDPELSARAFATLEVGGEVFDCYRTGDFACWDEHRILHFRGRRDHRVKVMGVRVELGDVESTLCRHPAVQTATVVVTPHERGAQQLIAFVLPNPGLRLTAEAMFAFCRERLPRALVPRAIHVVRALPSTSTGKVDRRALAQLAAERRP